MFYLPRGLIGQKTPQQNGMVSIKILGAGREVGRSAILLESSNGALLMDYGVNFDEKDRPIFPEHVRPRDLSAVVLTHSHLDHVGASPMLYTSIRPPLFATPLTLDVTKILLYDMIKLSGKLLPYDEATVNDMLVTANSVKYGERVELNGISFSLLPAGHIPGSAAVLAEVDGKDVLYTGDLNVIETKLMRPAELSGVRASTVIIESTYGATNHPPREATEKRFYESLREVVESGGVVLVPSFSVSRGQEILSVIAERDPPWSVWIDGMIREVAHVYLKYREYVRLHALLAKAMSEYTVVRSQSDRKNAAKEPGVIVASSGMLKGGPSLHYLKKIAENPKNGLFFVSFQGRGTPGRQILETGFALENMPVRARVEWFDFSSHIDQRGILQVLKGIKGLERVVLVHGEPATQEALAAKIREEIGVDVLAPAVGEAISL